MTSILKCTLSLPLILFVSSELLSPVQLESLLLLIPSHSKGKYQCLPLEGRRTTKEFVDLF